MRSDLAVLTSTVLWGTIWIPIRQLNGAGWDQELAISFSGIVALLFILPMLFYRRWWSQIISSKVWIIGLIFALGLALYMEAIVRGNIARMVLLFYMMPVWSAIFGRLMKGDPITFQRIVGIVLGLSGLAVIFYDGTGIPLPSGAADYMALSSGVVWAFAFTYSDTSKGINSSFGQAFATLVLLGPFIYVLTLIPGGAKEAVAISGLSSGPLAGGAWFLALGVIWLLPAITLTLFGAGRLQTSQVSIFLMLEVAISLASAAILIDEPFGMREAIGATLIIAASFAEFSGFRGKGRNT